MDAASKPVPAYTLRQMVLYFLKLGTTGFGGPPALVGYMHHHLVEERRWIAEADFKEGLALSQLAPGPLAAQLGIYLGYVHYGVWGATLTGLAFVLPSFLMVLGLGMAYVRFGGLPWMQAVFYGVGASVIGLVGVGTYRLSKKSLAGDSLLWVVFGVLAVATFLTETENIVLILGAGLLVLAWKMRPGKGLGGVLLSPELLQIAPLLGDGSLLWKIALFFLKAGAFVFGSGLAIVPFLYGGVVKEYSWLSEQQFLDAVAVAMITPGPVVITVGFIGYLVAGFPGAAVAALATFVPCYLFTILPAPYFRKYGQNPGIRLFVNGVTAAAVGAIAGAVLVLAKRQITDLPSLAIALVTVAILLRFPKLQEPLVIAGAALAGLLLRSQL